jgi:hypothetical protein
MFFPKNRKKFKFFHRLFHIVNRFFFPKKPIFQKNKKFGKILVFFYKKQKFQIKKKLYIPSYIP